MNIIYEKISKFCEDNSLSIRQFELACGIGNGAIGILKKHPSKKVSLDTIEKIQDKYKELGDSLVSLRTHTTNPDEAGETERLRLEVERLKSKVIELQDKLLNIK